MRPKVGLALSGGGTKGFAHIGVIKVLEKNKIPIDFISGTSAGAIIGGIYASGTSIKVLEKTIREMERKDLMRFIIDFGRPEGGLVKGEHIMQFVAKMLKEKDIEKFKIPFSAVAADVANEKEKIFNKGNVLLAIKSSIAIPGLVRPVKIGNSVLVDGGIVNPLPVDTVRDMGADVIIGVDVIGKPKRIDKKIRYKDIIFNSIKLMEKQIAYLRLRNLKNVLILQPNVMGISTLSVSVKNVERAIKNGEREARKKLPEIKNLLENYSNSIPP